MSLSNIKKILIEVFNRKNLHLFVILVCLLMQMFNWGEPYRFFAYFNMIIVLMYGFSQLTRDGDFNNERLIFSVFFIPLGFIFVHLFAVGHLIFIKEFRHILLATFFALGIYIMAKKNQPYIEKNILGFTIAIIFIYVVVQGIALWLFNKPYGTTKNPHYLALYSAVVLIVAVYCFFKVSVKLKWLIGLSILLLGIFLIHTSSRPTWIGLIFSSFLVLIFFNRQLRNISALSIATILIGLTLTNAGNFAGRFEELLTHLNTEERVVIWQDAWKMQTKSSNTEWIFGHGLNTFKENFKQYSYYHLQKVDFHSPHNFVLELLYLSGAVGLLLSILMFWLIYKNLFFGIFNQTQYKNIYLVLVVIITSNLIMVSITIPFFTSYNLNIIAIVTGTMLYLREKSVKQT